jgi:hypothetical protein
MTLKHKRRVEIDGVVYNSLKEAAENTGISYASLISKLADRQMTNYIYLDPPTSRGGRPSRRVLINGAEYASIRAASEAIGLPMLKISYKVNSAHHPDWQYI